eukprot:m.296429 g.296429  ORF g.296429 m.296429 type:complete len:479 (+) comp13390_c0_seq1:140-1576(+)
MSKTAKTAQPGDGLLGWNAGDRYLFGQQADGNGLKDVLGKFLNITNPGKYKDTDDMLAAYGRSSGATFGKVAEALVKSGNGQFVKEHFSQQTYDAATANDPQANAASSDGAASAAQPQPHQAQLQPQAPAAQSNLAVCFVAAWAAEAKAVRDVLPDIEFTQTWCGSILVYSALWTVDGRVIRLYTAAADKQGPSAAMDFTHQLLGLQWPHEHPSLLIMVGVAAADRSKFSLGDVLVARQAFNDAGKLTGDGRQPEIEMFKPTEPALRILRGIIAENDKSWTTLIKVKPEPAPLDMFLRYLYARENLEADDGPNKNWLADNGLPAAGPILASQVKEKFPQVVTESAPAKNLVTEDFELTEDTRKRIARDLRLHGEYPVMHVPSHHMDAVTWFSANHVRADGKAFAEGQKLQRDTLGVDMEAASFYQALQGTGFEFVAIKGVSDFGDERKDDSFHTFGKQAAAAFALHFVRNWSTLSLAK